MAAYHQYKFCIDASLRCAAIGYATAELMSLGIAHVKEVSKLCAFMCDACAAESSKYDDDHCRETAECCKKCADECEVIGGQ